MQRVIKKREFHAFIQKLIDKFDVIAPVKDKSTKFEKINSASDIFLESITQIPIKKYLLPNNELLVNFSKNKSKEPIPNFPSTILLGLRLCDLNAIQILDIAMKDPNYISRRNKTILIGYHCNNPDKFCFCNSMELNKECYDLFIYPYGDSYIISIGSKKGEELVKNLPIVKIEYKPEIKNKKSLITKNIEEKYKDSIWKTDVDKCLSCSACTVYCPTCNCFNIKDTLSINLKDSKRTRLETSCQLKSFSKVAGGKSYRDSRSSRFKHFIFHKIVYFKKTHDRYMCVGCGRCLRVCPTKIDWVNTINILNDSKLLK